MPSGSDTTAASAADGPSAADRPDGPRGTLRPRGLPEAGAEGSSVRSATDLAPSPATGTDGAPGGDGPAVSRRGRMQRLGSVIRREAPRTAGAVVAGVALALAFPPYGLWPLSVLAVAALSLLTRGRTVRQGAWTGLAFGWPFFAVLLRWLHVVGWDAVLGLAFIEAAFIAALGAALAVTSRLPLWPLWGACLWVAEEWARDRAPFGGFPWGRLAFANTGSPYTPLAAVGGAPLVTFAAALTGAAIAGTALAVWSLRRGAAAAAASDATTASARPGRGPDGRHGPVIGSLALALAVTAAGYAVPVPTAADDTADIAVVQGNVQQPGMEFLGRPMKILNNHVDATLDLARKVKSGKAKQPELVIWP
ncbi:MAG TPA: apolipoprotein N-acyltransferase, partial [Streptomyces sp.]|nr:apolipoprotein N-acyltransferase [Streptomyces sp.]